MHRFLSRHTHSSLRAGLCALLLVSTALIVPAAVVAREAPITAVQDLRYGTALYNYYLDDYMAALSELLVAEELGGIEGHGDNPEIMEGGLALGYNMERYASDIFTRLLADNRSVDVRDAAWYLLASLRYSKGDWARTEQALDNISRKPEKSIKLDANALRVNLLLKQNQPARAYELLKDTKLSEDRLPYLYFNIGSAYARNRDYDKAVEFFARLAKQEYEQAEYIALYDKAMTAAGYAHLFRKDYPQAIAYFSRVRLTSALSNRALLGYGWAAAEMGDYREALKPWLHLSKSDLIDENNQEAMIAVPYAYEKLGSENLALQYYQRAEASFFEEVKKIDDVLATLRNEKILEALKLTQRDELDWLNFAKDQRLSPNLSYLVELFSREKFQDAVREFRDLVTIQENLLQWKEKLKFYLLTIDQREKDRSEKADNLEFETLEKRIVDMREQRKTLSLEIERVAGERDFFALADGAEQDLIRRIERVEKNIELLRDSDPFIDEYAESLRRYKGLVLWQASESFGDRLWQSIKTLRQLDKVLAETGASERRIFEIRSSAPDLNPYKLDIDEALEKIDGLLARIDEAIIINEVDLKAQVIFILSDQRRRLFNYLGQSRLSVARLYDKASQAQETENTAEQPASDTDADSNTDPQEPQ